VWSNLSLRQQNYLNYPTFTEYFVITWLFSAHVLLWGPLLCGARVRPNMLNVPKSASALECHVSRGYLILYLWSGLTESWTDRRIFVAVVTAVVVSVTDPDVTDTATSVSRALEIARITGRCNAPECTDVKHFFVFYSRHVFLYVFNVFLFSVRFLK